MEEMSKDDQLLAQQKTILDQQKKILELQEQMEGESPKKQKPVSESSPDTGEAQAEIKKLEDQLKAEKTKHEKNIKKVMKEKVVALKQQEEKLEATWKEKLEGKEKIIKDLEDLTSMYAEAAKKDVEKKRAQRK